jgi:hypothetical protein
MPLERREAMNKLRHKIGCIRRCLVLRGFDLFMPTGTDIPADWPMKNAVGKKAINEIDDEAHSKNYAHDHQCDFFLFG